MSLHATAPAAGRPPRNVPLPARAQIAAAAARLGGPLPASPLVPSAGLGDGALLKLETLQPTGSFKVRGALAALGALPRGERVVTASAGNHGLGVAWAASLLGLDATVVVPETASPAKLRALAAFPARVLRAGGDYDAAERHALELAADGLRYVSPYNDPEVIAGQGTIAVELCEQLDGPLTVVCPLGGGGLASGLALWASEEPRLRVVGVESAGSAAMRAALDAGGIVPIPLAPTIADGLGGNLEPGSVTFELVARHAEDVVVVSEAEIAAAIAFLVREHGIVAEGAGAVAVAALLAGRVRVRGRAVALVTGRNIDPALLARLLASGTAAWS